MNKRYLVSTLLFYFISLVSLGQAMEEDYTIYSNNFDFKQGIYLSFNEFKSNSPGLIEEFERRGNNILVFNDSAKKFLAVNPNSVWGYCYDNNVYISAEGGFWKIVNVGQLSQFTAIVITKFQTVDTFGFPIERYSKVLSQLFLDFNTGEVKRLKKENLLPYLEETNILSKKVEKKLKSEEGLIMALKEYNKLNPIYFP